MTILVTGAAGFIGQRVSQRLLERGERVIGIDNLNAYYSLELKNARLDILKALPDFEFVKLDISDGAALDSFASDHSSASQITGIVHLAAQPGVRYSLENPRAYVTANVMGHLNILELARQLPKVGHVVYASSSSVYGGNTTYPFKETDRVDSPVSLYAATKKSDELISATYTNLYGLSLTGLRYFTVYGPWGRPDMAVWSFTEAICKGESINVYNHGEVWRDFTYIEDIVDGTIGALDSPPKDDEPGHRVFNIGNNTPEKVGELIDAIEQSTGKTATKVMLPMQPGDVLKTFANIDALTALTGYKPTVDLREGISRFVHWYKGYAGI